MPLSLTDLQDAVARHAAIRRTRRLQPAGGAEDKVFPPTYLGPNNSPTHAFEHRRVDGARRQCVLLDSVASQANRLEEALVAEARAGSVELPDVEVDFTATELADLGRISAMEAPHRVFDAILRDSRNGAAAFRESELGKRLIHARRDRATAMFEASPASLLFGAWNSTGEGGGLGAKFQRQLVSEIVGIGAVAGKKVSSRIDPLGTSKHVEIYMDEATRDWAFAPTDLRGKARKAQPSAVNHSNIPPNLSRVTEDTSDGSTSLSDGGVTIDHARHTAVITLAGLRRLRFPGEDGTPAGAEAETAARSVLAAMGLLALALQDREGYALRSRCDLIPEEAPTFELVAVDGTPTEFELDADAARNLYAEAVEAARAAGFALSGARTALTPSERLVELVRRSRERAEAGQAAPDDDA